MLGGTEEDREDGEKEKGAVVRWMSVWEEGWRREGGTAVEGGVGVVVEA